MPGLPDPVDTMMPDELISVDIMDTAEPPPAPEVPAYDTALNKAGGIKRVKWDAAMVIDYMLLNPEQTQRQIAKYFDYTEGWLSRMINSDAFQDRFAARKKEMLGPDVILAMRGTEERLTALANDSLDKLQEKLHNADPNMDVLLKTADLALRAKGYGAKQSGVNVNVNNSFVVALPQKETDSQSWSERYSPRSPQVIEGEPSSQ
jgi:hypothetical protein